MDDRKRRATATLSDDQLRVLYGVHVRDKVSAGDLALKLWQQLGFPTVNAARRAIKEGWKRLYLVESFEARRCEGVKRSKPGRGRRCRRLALHGKRFCLMHERADHAAAHAAAMRKERW